MIYRNSSASPFIIGLCSAVTLVGCDATQLTSDLSDDQYSLDVNTLSATGEFETCGSIEIDITGSRLLGKEGETPSTPEVQLDNPVPKGDYGIRLHYEDPSHPDQADQLNEQWYAEFFDKSGNSVFMTRETADLPTDEIISYTDVGMYIITADLYSVRAVHAYESDKYNSIHPTMIELFPKCDNSDQIPPVISLVGETMEVIYLNSDYVDQGATANDNLDGDLTSAIIVGGDEVNTSITGNYNITYDVKDSAGNQAAQVVRKVTVTIGDESTFFQ